MCVFSVLSKTESPVVVNIESDDQRYSQAGCECRVHNINSRRILPRLTVLKTFFLIFSLDLVLKNLNW